MELIDTHCHIHDTEFYPDNREDAYRESRAAGVSMICVGTDVRSSRESLEFCRTHEGCYPVVGIHPHDAKDNDADVIRQLVEQYRDEVVGIGEIGLDYYYDHSPREVQQRVLREQLDIARTYGLPVSFHVRDGVPSGSVWSDFWSILDEYSEIKGVLHSFTDTKPNLQEGLKRGLMVGVNGISTFTKDEAQQTLYRELSLERIVLETDAPFLTPKPFRGKMNIPARVRSVAEHQAKQKGLSVDDVIRITTDNARTVFGSNL